MPLPSLSTSSNPKGKHGPPSGALKRVISKNKIYSEDGFLVSIWSSWLMHAYHLSNLLIVSNSAIIFLMYVVL